MVLLSRYLVKTGIKTAIENWRDDCPIQQYVQGESTWYWFLKGFRVLDIAEDGEDGETTDIHIHKKKNYQLRLRYSHWCFLLCLQSRDENREYNTVLLPFADKASSFKLCD